MNKKILIILLNVLLFFILLTSYVIIYEKNNHNKIFPGIYIEEIYLGNLTKQEAEKKLSENTEALMNKTLLLEYKDDFKWLIKPNQIFEIDVHNSVEEALNYKKSNLFIKNHINRIVLKKNPVKLDLKLKTSYKKDNLIQDIKEKMYTPPYNAYFKINNDKPIIVNETPGLELDEGLLIKNIYNAILKGHETVHVPVRKIEPDITKTDLESMKITLKSAEYSSVFNKNQKSRTENIRLCAKKLNGYILAPNSVFSFNEVVGERTAETGYKRAPIYVNNEVISGIGGGVCQVSSTLYNIALLCELEIIERSNHSLPVSYVPLGCDATVNYNQIDLKFKNNTGSFLLINAELNDNRLIIKFFSDKIFDKKIKLEPRIIKTIKPPIITKSDLSLDEGKINIKQGKPGFVVQLYKIYEKGQIKKEKVISQDTYNPIPTIIYVGKKEVRKQIKDFSQEVNSNNEDEYEDEDNSSS